jgi:glycosyltransferase involved in cell wall biosynthesis
VNVLGGRIETNVMRYLPEQLLKVMVVHTITPATYAAARSVREHVHATICVSPRIRADLTGTHGFNERWTVTIHNGVDLSLPDHSEGRNAPHGADVIFLGRIDDSSKGVLWLPEILRHLPQEIRLTVAGDGPDLSRLRRMSADLGERITFLGAVSPARVGQLLSEHSIFLMPSRYEGYPVALIEAMAAGCVPVASQIKGVTSAIVTHGTDGFLFPIGNRRQAALAIKELCEHPERLASMSQRARAKARSAFNVNVMSDAYWDLLERLFQDPPGTAKQLSIQGWSMASGLQPGLRSYLPVSIKNFLRVTKERLIA